MRAIRATASAPRSDGGARVPWRVRVSGLLVALGLAGVGSLAVVPTAVAAPDDGLSETTAVRYEVDGTGPVEVTVTATIRNTTPDSGSYYYYFNEYSVLVPDSAEGLAATSRGSTLPLTLSRARSRASRCPSRASATCCTARSARSSGRTRSPATRSARTATPASAPGTRRST